MIHKLLPQSNYHYQELKNYIPHPDSAFKRIAAIAVPFLSLYKPLSFHFSLATNGIRTVTSIKESMETREFYSFLRTAIAVTSLVGTIFFHPLGMFLTTISDITMEATQCLQHLHSGTHKEALRNVLHIFNHVLHFSLFVSGNLSLSTVFLSVQLLTGVYEAREEIQNDHLTESGLHLVMACIRGHQLYRT